MGKAAILMVLGFGVVLMTIGPNLTRQQNRAYENYLTYVTETSVHNIALSAANMAASQLFWNNSWSTGYSNISFQGGSYNVSVADIGARKRIRAYAMLPNGVTELGLGNLYDTVEVLLQPSSFAKFAVYLNSMSGVSWFTGDTVWGPTHIEGTMNVLGTPVFYGKVTTKNSTNPATLPSGGTNPKFYGGLQTGVSIPLPTNLTPLSTQASSGGKVFTPPGSPAGQYEVRMQFNSDGTLSYKEYKGATQLKDTTVTLSTFAPNGAIVVNGGNIRIKGTVNGQYTVGALGSGSNGNAYIDGDVLLHTNPLSPGCTDLIGIVADQNVKIPIQSPVKHDYMIQGSIFARTGTFAAELNSGMGHQGAVTVLGSLTTNTVGAFSVASGMSIAYGYENHFRFDDRLYGTAPPFYPTTGLMEVVSWKE